MDYERIDILLKRYWSGETSLTEEEELNLFFNQKEIPERFVAYGPLFRYFQTERNRQAPTLDLPLKAGTADTGRSNIRRLGSWLMVAAAAVLLLLGMIWMRSDSPEPIAQAKPFTEDTYEDPEEAYEAVREALYLVSSKLNSSQKHAGHLQQFKRAASRLEQLNEIE